MMKSALLLLYLLVLTAASGPMPVPVTFSPMTKAEYLGTQKKQIITKPQVTFPLKKQDGRLIIPTAKGPKVFADIVISEAAIKRGIGEEDATSYIYLGYLNAISCHLIRKMRYGGEVTQWLLVEKSGRQIELWGEPVFSPDMQRIVASCQGIEYSGGQANIIQLLQVQKGILQEVWSYKPTTWEPTEVNWISSNELLVRKEMWTGNNQGNWFTYAKLSVR
jgi:hypothetical protein